MGLRMHTHVAQAHPTLCSCPTTAQSYALKATLASSAVSEGLVLSEQDLSSIDRKDSCLSQVIQIL